MLETDYRPKKPGRHPVLLLVVYFFLAYVPVLAILLLALPDGRIGIAIASFLSLGFSCLYGWQLGRIVCVNLEYGKGLVQVAIISILTITAYVFVGGALLRHAEISLPIECNVAVFAPGLLVTTSYLVGYLLAPGGTNLSVRRRLTLIVLLYGAVIAGLLTALTVEWPGTVVFPEPQELSDLLKGLEARRLSFPPQYSITHEEGGDTVIDATYTGQQPIRIPYDRVITATDHYADLGENGIRLLGYGLVLPGTTGRPKQFDFEWTVDGEPLLADRPGWIIPIRDRHRPKIVVGLEMDDGNAIRTWGFQVHLLNPPCELSSGGSWANKQGNQYFCGTECRYWIPGPAEVHLKAWCGEPVDHTMPCTPGSVLELPATRVMLAFARQGEAADFRSSRSSLQAQEFTSQFVISLRQNSSSKESTVTGFLLETDALGSAMRAQVLTRDGQTLEGRRTGSGGNLLLFEFDCKPGEIESFRIEVKPKLELIRLPIPDLKGFPEENRGVRNMLDMHIPYVKITTENDVYSLLRDTLQNRISAWIYTPADSAPRVWKDFTVREFLDHYYPGRWCVKDGEVNASGRGTNTVLGKIMRALGL